MINFCLVDPRTTHPTRGTAFSCGWDLYFPETKILLAGAKLRVDLMVQVFMPAQTMGLLALRSSVAMNYDISISGGIIGGRRNRNNQTRFNTVSFLPDRDYTGSIRVILRNHSAEDIVLPAGVAFVQLLPLQCHEDPMDRNVVRVMRGDLGFGSTNAS
jgi:dUTP pyrophosphatase